jgi:hypothetical protein
MVAANHPDAAVKHHPNPAASRGASMVNHWELDVACSLMVRSAMVGHRLGGV